MSISLLRVLGGSYYNSCPRNYNVPITCATHHDTELSILKRSLPVCFHHYLAPTGEGCMPSEIRHSNAEPICCRVANSRPPIKSTKSCQ